VRSIKDPKQAAEELVKWAIDRGSKDNITVVVIRLRDPAVKTHKRNLVAVAQDIYAPAMYVEIEAEEDCGADQEAVMHNE
jgi:serine/threonine protein phosphatase PrpC